MGDIIMIDELELDDVSLEGILRVTMEVRKGLGSSEQT